MPSINNVIRIDSHSGFKVKETITDSSFGWIDLGNRKFIYLVENGVSLGVFIGQFGPEPMGYIDRKEKLVKV